MKIRKENISARVSCALKKIVVDSDFSHREAYELGAKIIASGDAKETLSQVKKILLLKELLKKQNVNL